MSLFNRPLKKRDHDLIQKYGGALYESVLPVLASKMLRAIARDFLRDARLEEEGSLALDDFIKSKIKRGQLQNTIADERILIVYHKIFPKGAVKCGLTTQERLGIDHAFLADDYEVFQVW